MNKKRYNEIKAAVILICFAGIFFVGDFCANHYPHETITVAVVIITGLIVYALWKAIVLIIS